MQTENVTVREIAASSLAAVRVFERLGIDYCCGGARPLREVCREKGIDAAAIQDELETAMLVAGGVERDWAKSSLQELIRHIVETHHAYLRRELPAIAVRLEKVYRVYNQRRPPALIGLPEVFAALKTELETHLWKEEAILFPAIAAFEEAVRTGGPLPLTPFGPVSNPIHMMEQEHESAGQALSQIRVITQNFEIPEYACVTYRALMSGLKELEQDLHTHIHLENNILFPGAENLEALRRKSGTSVEI